MKRRLVVVGTLSVDPFAGMAWMHMQIAAGLLRLGHDVYYIEMSGNWPYDPVRQSHVADSVYALPYLRSVVERFGLGERWAYQRGYSNPKFSLEGSGFAFLTVCRTYGYLRILCGKMRPCIIEIHGLLS